MNMQALQKDENAAIVFHLYSLLFIPMRSGSSESNLDAKQLSKRRLIASERIDELFDQSLVCFRHEHDRHVEPIRLGQRRQVGRYINVSRR